MKTHCFLPKPRFERYVCYPESFGRYAEEFHHQENRTMIDYNWHIVLNGKGYVQIGAETITLRKGDGFLYCPGVQQRYQADKDDPWDILWVHFNGLGLSSLLQGKGDQVPWIFSWDKAESLESMWNRLLESNIPSNPEEETRLSALLYEMLSILIQHVETSDEAPHGAARYKLGKVSEWIRSQCQLPLTLEQMACEAGFSPSHFCRQFQTMFGKTPIEFLNECRILQSKSLLATTNWTVKRIAETVGFGSSTYFIQRFRKYTGKTPEQYRDSRNKW